MPPKPAGAQVSFFSFSFFPLHLKLLQDNSDCIIAIVLTLTSPPLACMQAAPLPSQPHQLCITTTITSTSPQSLAPPYWPPRHYNCHHLDPAMSVTGTQATAAVALNISFFSFSPFTSNWCRTPHHSPCTCLPPPQHLYNHHGLTTSATSPSVKKESQPIVR